MEPRPISIITRSYSAPAPVSAPAPTPPVPTPPPPPPDLIMPKPMVTLSKKELSKPQPGYSVTPEEIQKRLYSLKKISPEDEEMEVEENPGLADLMRKVMVNRRETGWCDSSSQSSGCISRNGGKLATVNSSWDDL